MDKQTLKADTRKVTGRKVKTLRRKGVLPANIYGKDVKSLAVSVKLSDFEKVFKKSGETGLVELVVGGKKRPVLIHNAQTDPVTDSFIHADFLQVDLKKKVTAQVPVELIDEAPAVKDGLGTVVRYIDEVEVEALPANLPEKFELSLAKLKEVDSAIFVKDIKLKGDVELKNDSEQMIVKVEPLREEEEPEPAAVEESETPEGEESTQETEGVAPDDDKGATDTGSAKKEGKTQEKE